MWLCLSHGIFHIENTNVTQSRKSVRFCQWHAYTPLRWSPPPLCQTTRGRTFLPDSHADALNTRAWLRKQAVGQLRDGPWHVHTEDECSITQPNTHAVSFPLCLLEKWELLWSHNRKLRGRWCALGQRRYSLLYKEGGCLLTSHSFNVLQLTSA